jgi:hypothetical protein
VSCREDNLEIIFIFMLKNIGPQVMEGLMYDNFFKNLPKSFFSLNFFTKF